MGRVYGEGNPKWLFSLYENGVLSRKMGCKKAHPDFMGANSTHFNTFYHPLTFFQKKYQKMQT
jgi:hypothetical protein